MKYKIIALTVFGIILFVGYSMLQVSQEAREAKVKSADRFNGETALILINSITDKIGCLDYDMTEVDKAISKVKLEDHKALQLLKSGDIKCK